jgi:endonuclease-8
VPEGDTIFRAARTLNRALAGKLVTRFETVFPQLQRVHDDVPVTGRTVEAVESQGKWMQMKFSGDLVLTTHMLMNGSWHIYRPGERWRRRREDMRIVVGTQDFVAVGFTVPVAQFYTAESLARKSGVSRVGPDVLAPEFNEAEVVERVREHQELETGTAILRQSILAGVGNVYKSEICFACGVNPFQLVSMLSEEELRCLVSTARKFLQANVTESSGDRIVTYTGMRRTTGRANPSERLWVYGRNHQPCRKCGTPIRSQKQQPGARTTFWCPRCQPLGIS